MSDEFHSHLMIELLGIRRKLYSTEAIQRLGRVPHMYPEFRSQFGEDMLAWDMLGNSLSGNYVEVGGFDGKTFSVSYAFDAIGWSGVLIEPVHERHLESLKNRNGPKTMSLNFAIGPRGSTGTAKFLDVGMFSVSDGHEIDFAPAAARPKREIIVPITDMDKALAIRWPKPVQIDLAVIDVEGAECDLLDGFLLNVWRPRVVIVEDNTFGKSDALNKYFESDYQFYGMLHCNRIYGRIDDSVVWRFMNPTQ